MDDPERKTARKNLLDLPLPILLYILHNADLSHYEYLMLGRVSFTFREKLWYGIDVMWNPKLIHSPKSYERFLAMKELDDFERLLKLGSIEFPTIEFFEHL